MNAPGARGPIPEPVLTLTNCQKCGTEVGGLNGRYACGVCGWINHWSQGSSPLPVAADDPDYPGRCPGTGSMSVSAAPAATAAP